MLNRIKKYLGIAIICSTMFQVTVPVGFCTNMTKIKEKIKQNEKNINDLKQKKAIQYKNQKNLNSQIKRVTKEIKSLRKKIEELNNKTNNKQKKITSCVKENNNLQKEIKNIDEQIKQINAESENIKKELLVCLKSIYMNGESNTLDALLSSENFENFVNNSTYSEKLSQRIKDILISYSKTINSIESMKNNKEKQIKNINATKEQIEKNVSYNSLQAEKIESLIQKENREYENLENLIKNNNKEDKAIKKAIKTFQDMNKQLQEDLRNSTEAIEKALKEHGINSKQKNNEKSKNAEPANNIKQSKNHIFPVLGNSSISRGVGIFHGHHHNGVDIQTCGKPNPVVASKSGRVIIATRGSNKNKLSGYGNVVVIDHGNGETTLYAHSKFNYSNCWANCSTRAGYRAVPKTLAELEEQQECTFTMKLDITAE